MMTEQRFVSCLTALLLLTACGGAAPATVEMSQAVAATVVSITAEPQQVSDVSYAVKVTKNGDELAVYQQEQPGNASGMLDGDLLQLFLSSPDNQDVLTVNIQGTEPGVYPVAAQFEAPQPGEAQLNFLGAEPPALISAQGQVTLDTFDGQTCSGSFSVTGTDIDGVEFSIEGDFFGLSVREIE